MPQTPKPVGMFGAASGGGGGGGGGGGDVSAALARLNFGIEDLNRQLRAEVRTCLYGNCVFEGLALASFVLSIR